MFKSKTDNQVHESLQVYHLDKTSSEFSMFVCPCISTLCTSNQPGIVYHAPSPNATQCHAMQIVTSYPIFIHHLNVPNKTMIPKLHTPIVDAFKFETAALLLVAAFELVVTVDEGTGAWLVVAATFKWTWLLCSGATDSDVRSPCIVSSALICCPTPVLPSKAML